VEEVEALMQMNRWALCTLGIGPDAGTGHAGSSHIAFIPPGTSPDQGMMFVPLDHATRYVAHPRCPENYYEYGMTVGPATLALAQKHLVVAMGPHKPMNVADTLLGKCDLNRGSSHHTQLFPNVHWLLDQEAAEELERRLFSQK